MNHGCWSFGKEMAGGRVCFFSRQVAVRQVTAIVKVTAPNLVEHLVEHQEEGNLRLLKKSSSNDLIAVHKIYARK